MPTATPFGQRSLRSFRGQLAWKTFCSSDARRKRFFDQGPPQYLKEFWKRLHEANGATEAGQKKGDELIAHFQWRVA